MIRGLYSEYQYYTCYCLYGLEELVVALFEHLREHGFEFGLQRLEALLMHLAALRAFLIGADGLHKAGVFLQRGREGSQECSILWRELPAPDAHCISTVSYSKAKLDHLAPSSQQHVAVR